ncbi:MAG: transglycosylase domain-containing protein [Leptospirales bacterium]|nr:transglycosylase domain-containing protein [Leptospirales bacterium]
MMIGLALGAIPVILFLLLMLMPAVFLPEGGDTFLSGLDSVTANRILDRNGKLIAELFSHKTGNLKANEIPEDLKSMLIFTEDQAFYKHGGVHWSSVVRAAVYNVISFGYSQGGSTISQQLGRILLRARQKTLFRKLRETSLAFYLESHLSKEAILTAYMNHVYLGHGAVGVENAARFYFLKGPGELNFAQMLAIVCLPSAPEQFSPIRYPDRLEKKMDVVFGRMKRENFPLVANITEEMYTTQKNAMLSNPSRSPGETVFGNREDTAPYIAEHVRLQIRELLGAQSEFGAGLTVETTIDAGLQLAATSVTAEFLMGAQRNFPPIRKGGPALSQNDTLKRALTDEYMRLGLGAVLFGMPSSELSDRTSDTVLQAAAIGVDPRSGAVLFMQGGRSFRRDNQINRALKMRRQTGSAIKPIIYSAGIESGEITAATRLDDSPVFVFQGGEGKKEFWLPENITGEYQGKIAAREALAQSRNVPAILVGRAVGLPRLSEQFKKFFFQDSDVYGQRFRMDETVAIGSLEMSPLEMAVAFGAFADNGNVRRPYMILKIKDAQGKVLFDGANRDEFGTRLEVSSRAIPGDVAEVMSSMLRDSARFANTGVYPGVLMGKTGTTNDYRDAWFVGAIPGLSAAVWVGYDNQSYSMSGGMGARLAGPLFGRIAQRSGFAPNGGYVFAPAAERVRICKETGKIAGPNCPAMTEFFAAIRKPEEACDLHGANGRQDRKEDLSRQTDFQ